MIELLLAAVLAAAAVVFVAVPFLRAEEPPAAAEPGEDALVAAEERDRALAELKELEFDHRTGKITDEDYRALLRPLRQRAARTLANGNSLSAQTLEPGSEQRFSERSLPSGRLDR
jgi:virulence-associated protein VagC